MMQPPISLPGISEMETRIMEFPQDCSIGVLSVRTDGSDDEWVDFAQAIGNVAVPCGKELRLVVSPTASFDPQLLANLESTALSVLEWVSTGRVNDAVIAHIQHLTSLKGLALWETNIANESLKYVGGLRNLQWLDIGDTRITDDGLRYLLELPFLHQLSLLNTRLTDEGLDYIERLFNLESLDLMNTLVSDVGVEHLVNLVRLKSLRIFQTRISEAGYNKLRSALPRCQIRFRHPHLAEQK
jgi:hypothetical protein